MNPTVFLITYGIYFTNGKYEGGKMRVKNCEGELHAKVKLEGYLRKKHTCFDKLVVFKCDPDFMSDDGFQFLRDIFKM